MADQTERMISVRAPDGALGRVPESAYQRALDAGYTNVTQDEASGAQEAFVSREGEQAAADAGMLRAPRGSYSVGQEFMAKAVSSATFGLGGLNDPTSRLNAQRFQTEHPGAAFGAEVLGQLPAAVVSGGVGEGLVAASEGAGLLARGAVRGADFAAQALVGGAQTEAEQTRVAGDDFSWTDAAVAGVAGEALGRGAAAGFSAALGTSRNLLARATRETVATDAASSLSRGGMLNDFRVAHHAEQYQNELATLAADDLDRLETSFAEVSRQDRKRARITRVVTDAPEVQAPIRAEAIAGLGQLREALSGELGETPGGPARALLRQLDERATALETASSGKRLWRLLDENRQALQDYAQDLHQAYDNAPGSAWLSREGLAALDAAERTTRESLLREDAWGREAAEAQAAYNVPFHEKYFPSVKTVRGKLMQTTQTDARGFPVFRGDPGRVRTFFARDVGDVDSARLAEQFREYLDGVAAIARAGERDTPAAARDTLEAVRRLRKATANAELIQEAVVRTGRRGRTAELGFEAAGAIAGASAAGPVGAAVAFGALRGARAGDFLVRVGKRLGWGAGEAESMAGLLGRDALPAAKGPDATFVDDLLDGGPEPSGPPSGAPPAPGGGGGVTSSMAAEARRGSWQPTPAPASGVSARPTGVDLEAPEPTPAGVRSTAPERAARETVPVADREMHRGAAEALETDGLREAGLAGRQEAARMEALTEGEFREVVRQLRASGDDKAGKWADEMLANRDELVDDGLVDATPARSAADEPAPEGWGTADAGRRAPVADDFNAQAWAAPQANLPDTAPPVSPASRLDDLLTEGGISRRALMTDHGFTREELNAAVRTGRVRDSGARLVRVAAPSRAGADAAAAFQDMGIEIRMGAPRLSTTLDTVFGEGRAPTPEQWRRIIPLDTLRQLGEAQKARIDVLGDSFIWSAEGVEGVAAPHRTWDGTQHAGGFTEEAWRISRTFSRDDAGHLEVHHDHFFVRGDLQGNGAGAKVLKDMLDVYPKIGVDVVTVDSVEIGKYFWPSIGFNSDQAGVNIAVRKYKAFLQDASNGLRLTPEDVARAVADADRVRSLPALAQAEYGKPFLLQVTGPWNFGLRLNLRDSDPMYHLMRGRLDIAAAGLAALGAGALEGSSNGGTDQSASAAATFGATAGLLRQGRGRLVATVARRLFSAAAEPALRVTARLAYSRSQLDARREEFTTWQQDPQQLVARVAEGLRDAPPDAFSKSAAGVFAAASFLRGKLPQTGPASPIGLRGVPVSAEAAGKYARYEQAALQPGAALRESSESGYLSPELLETLQELYPDLLAEVRVSAVQTVREAPPGALSIQAKTQYARLFDGDGALADPAFSASAVTMVNLAYDEASPAPKPPTTGGSPGVSRQALAVQAPQPWRTA